MLMSRTSIASCSAALVVAVLVVGCKGETVVKDNPDTLNALDICKKTLEEKNKLVTAIQDENSRLQRNGTGSGGEIVVAIEGNALTVKPGAPGVARPIDDKAAAAASKEFLDVVAKSRGAIQKCYEQALKKNTGLQAKTVTLTVSASFSQAGAFQSSNFSPSLGDAFDNCIKTVASRWALPTNSPAMTFKAQVSLTPS
jgi:hypothetical protein